MKASSTVTRRFWGAIPSFTVRYTEKAAVAPQLIFNQQLDAVLTALFVGVLWTVIGAMLLGARRHVAGTCTRGSSEAPYVRSRAAAAGAVSP